MEILPAIIPIRADEIKKTLERVGCEGNVIHIDATDGVYAGELCWIPNVTDRLPQINSITYEAHLMVTDQRGVGERFLHAGVMRVIGQAEAFASSDATQEALASWRDLGAEVGLAILLDTPLETLEPFKEMLDTVQIMSIPSIGAQGVAFDERAWARLEEAVEYFPSQKISIDGGVKLEHIPRLVQLGVDRAVVGSGILKAESPKDMYQAMVAAAN